MAARPLRQVEFALTQTRKLPSPTDSKESKNPRRLSKG